MTPYYEVVNYLPEGSITKDVIAETHAEIMRLWQMPNETPIEHAKLV